ncbi:MAG: hypothetical protein ACR2M9_05155 [Cyanophyceae cyanobacterium]
MIIYHRRQPQRVFTPEEYASMGYTLRADYNLDFGTADAPLPSTSELLVYRADSKGEFARDAAVLAVDIALAPIGAASLAGRVARSAWPIVKTFLTYD